MLLSGDKSFGIPLCNNTSFMKATDLAIRNPYSINQKTKAHFVEFYKMKFTYVSHFNGKRKYFSVPSC